MENAEMLVELVKKRKEELRNEVETFRSGLVISLEALVRKATSGFRVFQYPNKTKPALIYFTVGESIPVALARVCACMVSAYKLEGFVLDTKDGLRHAVAHLTDMLKNTGYDLRVIHLLDAKEMVCTVIEKHELEGGRVVAIAIDELEDKHHDGSGDAAHPAGNGSDTDGPDESNAGGEASVLPVE